MGMSANSIVKAGEELFRVELKRLVLDDSSHQYDYGVDYSDDIFGCIGLLAGVDKQLCSIVAKQIRRNFKKSWSQLSFDEWQIYKKVQPGSWEYLKDIIGLQLRVSMSSLLFSANNRSFSLKNRFSCGLIQMICGSGRSIKNMYGEESSLLKSIYQLQIGDIRESVTQWLIAYEEYGRSIEVLCCREQIIDEIIFQSNTINNLIDEGSILIAGTSANYQQALSDLEIRLKQIE